MTVHNNYQETSGALSPNLEEENELLLLQLHQVQEELENYYLRNLELEKVVDSGPSSAAEQVKGWVDDELPVVLAEKQRLQALVEAQQKVHQLELDNGLSVKVGEILIQGVNSPASLLSVPGKLGKIRHQTTREKPPRALGGKNFDKVILAYGEGEFDAVEKLMAGVSISPATQANGYTALARHLMIGELANAAEAARRAYSLDPKPYRLKWLAFRLHEVGEVSEAEAFLDLLPQDTQFSDSEARQASQLRYEAKYARQLEAKQKTGYSERRVEIEKQLRNLSRERAEQSELAAKRGREVETLRVTQAQLEEEKSALSKERAEQALLAAERGREVEALRVTQVQLEQEKSELSKERAEQSKLAAERGREVETLRETQVELEQEKSDLSKERLRLIQEEMVRAEAQLDLVKDVLLREMVDL